MSIIKSKILFKHSVIKHWNYKDKHAYDISELIVKHLSFLTSCIISVSLPSFHTLPVPSSAAPRGDTPHSLKTLCFTVKTRANHSRITPHLTRGTMSSGSRDLAAAGPPSVWIWICLPDIKSQSVQQKSHRARRMVSLLRGCNWSSLYTAISFKLYLAESAKSALLCCHFITHSLAARAHVAPGSWSTAVSLLHQQRSFFSTRTEFKGKYKKH